MLFRYKIDKSYDYICEGVKLIHYNVTIQKYNGNNIFFKWETCKDTTLKVIAESLVHDYYLSCWDNAIQEITDTISKYGGVDQMVCEYIRKIIIKDMRLKDDVVNAENSLDNIALTNGWHTFEIKEK